MTNEKTATERSTAVYDADLYGASGTGYVTSIAVGDEEEQDERERLVARCVHVRRVYMSKGPGHLRVALR